VYYNIKIEHFKQYKYVISRVYKYMSVRKTSKKVSINFQILDWSWYDTDVDEDDDNDISKFVIRLYGTTDNDKKIYIRVDNFSPYFYIKLKPRQTLREMRSIIDYLKERGKIKKKFHNYMKSIILVEKHDFYGFTNYEKFKFVRLEFFNYASFKAYANVFRKEIIYRKKNYKFQLYESNLEPMIRFMHRRNLCASGWAKVRNYRKLGKITRNALNLSASWKHIDHIESNDMVPLIVASFDIECTSESGNFPRAKNDNDRVIQIGTTFNRYGEPECFYKHIITLGTCDPIDGVDVESYDNEKDVLMAWTMLMTRMNPDILTGYNIFGFDEKYLYKRAKKLGIEEHFSKLGRLNERCEYKKQKLQSSSLGCNFLYYYDMSGMVQVDLFKVIQRDHKLPSYKLDSVAAYFIKEKIIKLVIDRDTNTTKIYTNNTYGLEINRVVKINYHDGYIDNQYDGVKYRILDMYSEDKLDVISVKGLIEGDIDRYLDNPKYKVFWSQAKDDVSPQDIFRLQKGSSADRKIVAEYCVQDCVLCNKLMEKLQILTNNIGMSNVCSVPLSYIFLRGQGIKIFSLVAKKCAERKHLIPALYRKSIPSDEILEKYPWLNKNPDVQKYKRFALKCEKYKWTKKHKEPLIEQYSLIKELSKRKYILNLRKKLRQAQQSSEEDPTAIRKEISNIEDTDCEWDENEFKNFLLLKENLPEEDDIINNRWIYNKETDLDLIQYVSVKQLMKKNIDVIIKSLLECVNITDPVTVPLKSRLVIRKDYDSLKVNEYLQLKSIICSLDLRPIKKYMKSDLKELYEIRDIKILQRIKHIHKNIVDAYHILRRFKSIVLLAIYKFNDICKLANLLQTSKIPIEYEGDKVKIIRFSIRGLDSYLKVRNLSVNISEHMCEENPLLSILKDGDGYEGAVVLPPTTGVHFAPIVVKDYASLYPRSMIQRGISHETEVVDKKYLNIEGYRYIDVIYQLDNGLDKVCTFAKHESNKAILPEILEDLLDARADTRKLQKSTKDAFKWNVLEGLQLAYKITANSLYGQTGAKTSKIYNKNLAASTTATGREMLFAAKKFTEDVFPLIVNPIVDSDYELYLKRINELFDTNSCNGVDMFPEDPLNTDVFKYGKYTNMEGITRIYESRDNFIKIFYEEIQKLMEGMIFDPVCVYGDTDSVFTDFNFKDKKTGKKLDHENILSIGIKMGILCGDLVNCIMPHPHNLEYEKTFYPFILLSKKRYVGNLYETDPNKYYQKSMGIVLKRRDNAPIVKVVVGGIVDTILNERNTKKAIQYTKTVLKDILKGNYPIENFIITKTLKSNYKNRSSIVHAVLADRMGQRDPGNKPQSNDRIPYVFIMTKQKKIKLQADKVEHPNYVIENNIKLDYLYYIEKQIMKPSIQFLEKLVEDPYKIFNRFIIAETNKRKGIRPIKYWFNRPDNNIDDDNKDDILTVNL